MFDLCVGRGSESELEASRAGVVESELGFLWASKYLKQDKVSWLDTWVLGARFTPLPPSLCPLSTPSGRGTTHFQGTTGT